MQPLRLSGFSARALSFDDLEALSVLLEQCREYFLAADGRAPSKHAAHERLADALGDDDARLFGFFRENEIAPLHGILELRLHEPDSDDATIVLLLLAPSSRRRKLGREIVESLVRALEGEELRALRLGVQDHELGAHAFWQELGFVEEGRARGVTRYVRSLVRDS